MATIESEQTRIIELTQVTRGPFYIRYASYPKKEDLEFEPRSEDYIVADFDPNRALFALCDGVGTSFYGYFGSQFLGETLLNWLRALTTSVEFTNTVTIDAGKLDEFRHNLREEIDKSAQAANVIVMDKDLNNKPELVRMAEEDQRNNFGTQSNFVCGLILPKTSHHPNGLLLLFWLGNARIRLFRYRGEKDYEDLTWKSGWGRNPTQLKETWSSKDGTVGNVYSYSTDLSEVTHIVVYSDGLESVDERVIPGFEPIAFKKLAEHAQSVKDDDVSFLEIKTSHKDITVYADDIVPKLRSRHKATSNEKSIRGLETELKESKQRSDDLSRINARLKKRITQASILFSLIFLFIGLITGLGLNTIIQSVISTPTPTATITIKPTRIPITETPVPPTETPTPLDTTSPTEIVPAPTETSTETITPEFTISPEDTVGAIETIPLIISTVPVTP